MSIWKTPDQKPKYGKQLVWMAHRQYWFGWYDDGKYIDRLTEYRPDVIDRWCYLDDLIAQADKAERLEEENEAMREEFEVWHGNHKCVLEDIERLQKAVDLALERFDDIRRLNDTYYDKPSIIATETTEEIKQLIKEKTNEQSNAD